MPGDMLGTGFESFVWIVLVIVGIIGICSWAFHD